MNGDDRISDELLNAYVDGELDSEELQRIEHAMQRDDRLHERVAELQRLKQLVRSAYIDEMPGRAPSERPRMPRTWSAAGLAASVAAFALGVALTWGWFSYTDGTTGPRVASMSGQDGNGFAQTEQAFRAVFHVSRNDPEHLRAILNEAEALLTTTAQDGETAWVRIIASGGGLSLFEKSSAPEAERISAMKLAYQDQLIFKGCGVAYQQLKEMRAVDELELLPEIQLVELGVLELMRRQRQGWAYIRL